MPVEKPTWGGVDGSTPEAVSNSKLNQMVDYAEQYTDDAIASGAPPTGAAGGDLTGTYPDPTIASNAVTDSKIGNRTIDQATALGGTPNTGLLSTLLGRLANLIKAITGKTNWYDTPDTTLATAATHIVSTANPHSVTKAQVGLSNVDNTSDANKPISTATQTALDGKSDVGHTHDDRYYTESETDTFLGSKADLVAGKVPSSQLPSYVDDVEEYADFASLPGTGETGKIYLTLDTNYEYRWSGATYIRVNEGVALGETSSTAYRGDRGKAAYDHSQVTDDNPHETKFTQLPDAPNSYAGASGKLVAVKEDESGTEFIDAPVQGPNDTEQAAYLNSILTDADGNVMSDADGTVLFTPLA